MTFHSPILHTQAHMGATQNASPVAALSQRHLEKVAFYQRRISYHMYNQLPFS
jgi:hypothetical protein